MGLLEDKVAVITGAAGMIGRATTAAFHREGAVVVGLDVREQATDCEVFLTADLSDEAQVARAFAQIDDRFGRLDVLFSNAGVALPDDDNVLRTGIDVWQRTIAANLTSMFLVNKHGIPLMLRGGGGSLINTASLLGSMGSAVPGIAYTATKGAVLALTADVAVEFARKGLRANTISPGPVETPLFTTGLDEAGRQRRLVHVPTGRFTEAAEIAESVVFLASDRASHINGIDLKIDGGMSVAYVTPEE
ncbi:SDR family oxidoreductase [Leucobacter soli]|uniref:Dihydroanticapsin 7-dehydrogenase n=1 Tax=Leucobacter soli TaxID=2812850 RepID=A0A916NMU9_9MICO|nr:SDR family oxidoreductase [Leucobacter soli]CAG7608676.1 Dihydroanticapsin 7-dehydrogenase [Leucobacter soli]